MKYILPNWAPTDLQMVGFHRPENINFFGALQQKSKLSILFTHPNGCGHNLSFSNLLLSGGAFSTGYA
jgi:hypothetical protein